MNLADDIFVPPQAGSWSFDISALHVGGNMKPQESDWIEAKKKYHLTDTHIRMAKQLGMNPRKFGSLANHKQEPWKAPLPEFIEGQYFKRFRRTISENETRNSTTC